MHRTTNSPGYKQQQAPRRIPNCVEPKVQDCREKFRNVIDKSDHAEDGWTICQGTWNWKSVAQGELWPRRVGKTRQRKRRRQKRAGL